MLRVDDVKKALEKAHGNMAAVARAFGVSRSGVWKFCNENEELKEYQKELREAMLDKVEGGLHGNALQGNVTAQIFILKTIGRNRGYVERHEIAGPNGPVEVMVKHVKRDSNTD